MDNVSLILSIVSAVVSVAAVVVSYLAYASQIHPDVVVYTETDSRTPTVIYIVIHNVGKSAARDVRFSHSEKIPSDAFGIDAESAARYPKKWFDSGPLIDGIPFLPAGGKRSIMWGQFAGIYSSVGDRTIRTKVRYRSRQNDFLDFQDHEGESQIEIASFKTTDAGDHDGLRRIAKALESIAKEMKSRE